MDKEKWLKAIKCTKEELIEWLNEMYEDDKRQKDIIKKYEIQCKATIKDEEEAYYNPVTMEHKIKYYTKVNAGNFEYIRNWRY